MKSTEEPRQWEDETTVPGNVTTVQLYLSPYFNYQFRVLAVNGIGKSPPSVASEIYSTPPAGKHFNLQFSMLLHIASSSNWKLVNVQACRLEVSVEEFNIHVMFM